MTFDLKINFDHMTYISWSSDFALYLEDFYYPLISYFGMTFDLILNVGHSDLHFMIH